jgi:hypothetical protein
LIEYYVQKELLKNINGDQEINKVLAEVINSIEATSDIPDYDDSLPSCC